MRFNLVHKTLISFVIFATILLIIIPGLPLKFSLQQTALSIFACCFVCLFFLSLAVVISNEIGVDKQFTKLLLLLSVFLLYLLFQLLPMDKDLIAKLSPSMTDVWITDAYGFKGKSVLTADISATIWFFVSWFSYIVLLVILLTLIRYPWQFILITSVIFLLGIYQILFDEITKQMGYEYISASQTDGHSYRLTGTFVNSNNLSAVINLSIAAGLSLLIMVLSRLKYHKTFFLICLATLLIGGELLLLYGCIKAGSAGGLLSLILAAGVITLILMLRQFSARVLMLLVMFLTVIVISLVFFWIT